MGNVRAAQFRATPSRTSSAGRTSSARAPWTGSSPKAGPQVPVTTDANLVEAVLELQQSAGNQAVAQLLAGGRADTPPLASRGHFGLGNRARTSMLSGVAQRVPGQLKQASPSSKPAAPGGKAAGVKGASSSFNSYVDLFMGFQDMAAAAVNRGGAGIDAVRFGKDLSRSHRTLLAGIRAAMIQGQDKDKMERGKATIAWAPLGRKLQAAVGEAAKVGIPGDGLMAVTDAIAQLNTRYFHKAPRKSDPEVETLDSYQDAVNGINALLFAFERMGESGEGIIREEVPKRKDVLVSQAVVEINKKQRDRLEKVAFGSRLTKEHGRTLESLRELLILARTESAGSAYKAWSRWQRLEGTLQRILKRTLVFGDADLGPVRQGISGAGETLAQHYRVVHQQSLRTALMKERSREEKKIDQTMGVALGPGGAQAIQNARAIQDFQYALATIERGLMPSADRPGEWTLNSGGKPIRIRSDQALAIREAARTQVKEYMASIVTSMVQAWDTYDQLKRGTGSTRRKVLGFLGGADDPGDQSDAKNEIIHFRDAIVYPLADQGQYIAALEEILQRKGDVERRARAVGDYDSDLDKGFKRLSIAASVVQVALVSLVPIAGQAAMAATVVEGAVVAGASGVAVAGTSVAAGAGASALAETSRQLAFDDHMDVGKIAKTARTGGVIGLGAVGPAATKELSNLIAPGATGSTLVGANMAASTVVGGATSGLGGNSVIEGAVGGGVGSLAGSVVNAVAPIANAPLTNLALQGGAGGGVAYLTGGDVASGVVGGMASSAGDKFLANKAAAGGTPAPAPDAPQRNTTQGVGIDPRPPAAITGPGVDPLGATIPGANVRPPVRPAPPTIASPEALGDTMPMPAAEPAPAPGTTMHGTGIDPRAPAPADPLADPLPSAPGPQPAPAGGGTQESIMPAPRPGNARPGGRGRRSQFAAAPEYAGREPIMGKVALIIDSADEAAALYNRLHDEGQVRTLGSADADLELMNWRGDGGEGAPPMAWVRAGDGVVRFNFSRFPQPNRGGYSNEPLGPISMPSTAGRPQPAPAAAPGQQPMIREWARLPEFKGAPPLFGPTSKVGHVITDMTEAQALWGRLVQERQLHIHEHHEDFAALNWSDDGGVGPVPIAWVRASDGVIRFNLGLFKHGPSVR